MPIPAGVSQNQDRAPLTRGRTRGKRGNLRKTDIILIGESTVREERKTEREIHLEQTEQTETPKQEILVFKTETESPEDMD